MVHFEVNLPEVLRTQFNGAVVIEKTFCADRGIPIETTKIDSNFFNQAFFQDLFFKCEALKELTLSSHFQKFLGFDDLSDPKYHYYFFEYVDIKSLFNLVNERKLVCNENSQLFHFVATEILNSVKDIVYHCTYSFKTLLSLDNVFFDTKNLRVLLRHVRFGERRRKILDSHAMLEAKMLFNFAIMLLELLEIQNSALSKLPTKQREFEGEGDFMQRVFDNIKEIEVELNSLLKNDRIIAILVECLVTPYKANLVLASVYEKKNFLKEILDHEEKNHSKRKGVPKRKKEASKKEVNVQADLIVTQEKYYEDGLEEENLTTVNRAMSLQLLAIYPYFKDFRLTSDGLSTLLKCGEYN